MARKLRQFRIRFQYDDQGAQNLETPDGKPLPGSEAAYLKYPIRRLINPDDDPVKGARRDATYEEYCAYEGDPNRHVVLEAILEECCPHCGEWSDARDAEGKDAHTSLCGIDFMDDNREAGEAGMVYTSDAFHKIPGYLREVTRELLSETGTSKRRINQLAPAWKLGQR